jgi:hypothetical protein
MTGEALLLPGLLASGRLVVDLGLFLSCWSRFWSSFSIVLKVCRCHPLRMEITW